MEVWVWFHVAATQHTTNWIRSSPKIDKSIRDIGVLEWSIRASKDQSGRLPCSLADPCPQLPDVMRRDMSRWFTRRAQSAAMSCK